MKFISNKYNDELDENLIQLTLNGNKEALNTLIHRHKDWIYNISLRMTGNSNEAEDVTQEILIKIVTKLSTFKFKSSFKTWLYRVTINHVMTMRKKGRESVFSSFEKHKDILRNLSDSDLGNDFSVNKRLLIEETKVECMLGMLLCLSREQRIVFIIGGIFGIKSTSGAEILEITEANFRKRLSRARHELKNFMDNNCSLINNGNSCKCSKKTKAAIKMGIINPENLQYADDHLKSIRDMVDKFDITVDDTMELRYQNLFKDNPYKIFETKEFSELMGYAD